MKKHGLCLCLILCLSLWNAPNGYTRSLPDASSLQQALEQLEQTYSAELVLGTPLEVNGVKLIPLATVGFGSGEHALSPDSGKSEGMGGVVIPTGVIVVSGSNIRILHFSKGFVEQLVNALAPVLLQRFTRAPVAEDSLPENSLPLTNNAKKSHNAFMAIYWQTILLFMVVWLVLACVVHHFLPDKIAAIAASFQYNFIKISILGVLGYGITFFFIILFTISIIGIPLALAVILLMAMLTVLGALGFALFIGQQSAVAFKYHYSEVRLLMIGAILFALLVTIPVIGIIIWALIAIFGFGVTLQMQLENWGRRCQ